MINRALFKKEFKSNLAVLLIFLAIILMYVAAVIKMYDPSTIDLLTQLTETMGPLMSAMGMNYIGGDILNFCVNYLFGFILIFVPIIYIILLSNKLVCKYVDNGSMSYLLATPNKRKKIVLTQLWQTVLSLAIIVIFTVVSIIFFCEIWFPGDMNINSLLLISLGLFFMLIFISGLCFMISCICNDVKWSYGISILFTMGFYLIQMLSQISDKSDFLHYFTPFSLYNPSQIVENSDKIIWTFILFAVGVLFYIIGSRVFIKKDLHI